MLSEALAMSEALGDRRAHQTVLLESAYKHFNCMRSPEHAKAALRAAELLRAAGDVWNMADALTTFQVASALAGRLDGVAQFEEETTTLARRLGHVGAKLQSTWARGMRDWLVAADLDQLEASGTSRSLQIFLARYSFDVAVAGHGGSLSSHAVDVDGMVRTFAEELAAVSFNVSDKGATLQASPVSGSRITSAPASSSSASGSPKSPHS